MRIMVAAPIITAVITSQVISPDVYANLGLPANAHQQVQRSAHRQAVMQEAGFKLTGLLRELGIVTPVTRHAWKMTGLVA
jgi:hypothetical protein